MRPSFKLDRFETSLVKSMGPHFPLLTEGQLGKLAIRIGLITLCGQANNYSPTVAAKELESVYGGLEEDSNGE